jgi:hypothetical protein
MCKHVSRSAHAYYVVCTSATMQVSILTQTFVLFIPPELPRAWITAVRQSCINRSVDAPVRRTTKNLDMCCSVHFCNTSKFCSQQMHTLYFVFARHFTSLPTCFDPCWSSSGHLIHWTSSSYYYTIHISLYNSLWLKQVLSVLCI